MGRFAKNTIIRTGGYSIRLPAASNFVSPSNPEDGHIRYNKDTQAIEYYMNGQWRVFSSEGQVTVVKDSFSATGSDDTYGPMSYSYESGQEAQVLVFLNTVFQNPGVNYTFNGTANITFTSIPLDGASIVILHNLASTAAE